MFAPPITGSLDTPLVNRAHAARHLLVAVVLMLSATALIPTTSIGEVSAHSCYPQTVAWSGASASGYKYGKGRGHCPVANDNHTLSVCIRKSVSGPDYDITCARTSGSKTFYEAEVRIASHACGQLWIQSRIDGLESDGPRHWNCGV